MLHPLILFPSSRLTKYLSVSLYYSLRFQKAMKTTCHKSPFFDIICLCPTFRTPSRKQCHHTAERSLINVYNMKNIILHIVLSAQIFLMHCLDKITQCIRISKMCICSLEVSILSVSDIGTEIMLQLLFIGAVLFQSSVSYVSLCGKVK